MLDTVEKLRLISFVTMIATATGQDDQRRDPMRIVVVGTSGRFAMIREARLKFPLPKWSALKGLPDQ